VRFDTLPTAVPADILCSQSITPMVLYGPARTLSPAANSAVAESPCNNHANLLRRFNRREFGAWPRSPGEEPKGWHNHLEHSAIGFVLPTSR